MLRLRDSRNFRLLCALLATTSPVRLRWKHGMFRESIAIASFEDETDVSEFISTIAGKHDPAAPLDVASLIEPYAETQPFA